mmetsp:Transcript_19246/g.34308  ORF Transcript_19246/g.34308 Transcript_19246/m.34308 type:complete len:120 (-) Transcript_19246:9-368(-)
MDVERVDELGQGHLLENVEGEDREALFEQLEQLDGQYPGGLEAYINNAQKLLESSKAGENPYDGYVPRVPEGERLQTATSQFDECEELGMKNMSKAGFVLVAGGLGERLGYNGIKVALA